MEWGSMGQEREKKQAGSLSFNPTNIPAQNNNSNQSLWEAENMPLSALILCSSFLLHLLEVAGG